MSITCPQPRKVPPARILLAKQVSQPAIARYHIKYDLAALELKAEVQLS